MARFQIEPERHRSQPALTVSRPLAVLDEFRVPHDRLDVGPGGSQWGTVSAGEAGRALHWWDGETGSWGRHVLGEAPFWAAVVPERAVAEFASALGGRWWPDRPILDRSGDHCASIWRNADGGTILPFDPDEALANYRSERYRSARQGGGNALKEVARRGYYGVRPLMPRHVQIRLRRAFTRIQARSDFPRWPVETALHDLCDLVLGATATAVGEPVPYIAPWPRGYEWALVLTHDVETAAGRDAIDRVLAVEQRLGFRSSWNLVPERYSVDDALVERLAADGSEVGIHGLRHDGKDLGSLRTLRERLPAMRSWAERWSAVGFRAPATQRVWEWMPMLGFDYDSSSPDTDPYEPIPGGCCSWLPFFNEELVELPITMPQDHTLFVILRRDETLWHEKADVLRCRGGMALLIVHPDYMLDDASLGAYERFLERYRDDRTLWNPLPREVSDWWRRRATTTLSASDGAWRASGPAAAQAAIAHVAPRSARPGLAAVASALAEGPATRPT
jgi:hypothetical protein